MEEALHKERDVNEELQKSLKLFDELEGAIIFFGHSLYKF